MDQEQLATILRSLSEQVSGGHQHTYAEAAERWHTSRVVRGALKPRTIEAYTRGKVETVERWGHLVVSETDWPREVAELVDERGRSAWLYVHVARSVLITAHKAGWTSEPHGLSPLLKRCRYAPREIVYTAEQLQRLTDALNELDRTDPIDVPAREVIRGCKWSGCRVSEIASLRTEDIGQGWIRLRDSKSGPRTVPTCAEFQALLLRQRVAHGWVFPGVASGHVSTRTVLARFVQARDHAGLRAGTVHTLRHTWATLAAEHGVPLPTMMAVLGHSAAWVTARYLHSTLRSGQLACAVVANAIANAKGGRS